MKVTVTKALNVRVGKPSLNAPCFQYLAPGTEVIVDGSLYKGDSYDGIDTWMKDTAGNFYWSGGVAEIHHGSTGNDHLPLNSYFEKLKELVDWNDRLSQIPAKWRASRGDGVNVAILDTGVFAGHEDLKEAISFYEDFTTVKDLVDYEGHGTHVCGLIGARASTSNGVIGVAPSARLIGVKVLPDSKDGDDFENYQPIIDALDYAVEKGADIINMSLSLAVSPAEEADPGDRMKIKALRNKIKEIGEKNIIIVAAGGDNGDLRNSKLFFPADCPEIISVASVSAGYFARNPVYSKRLDVVGPTINYLSTFKSPLFYERAGGCSMTTAFISGIIALAISSGRTKPTERFPKNKILAMLNKCSLSLDEIDYTNDANFFFHVLNAGT
ncbi:MAG: S8 family peptidase [Bacteroidales bacterium]